MDRKILVTGANGQLGLAINHVISDLNDDGIIVINSDISEPTSYCPITLDITNSVAVLNLVHNVKPDIIINCVAFTAVDLCETERERAYAINAIGAKNLAVAANELDIKLVHVSTDYVFSGDEKENYVESDQPNPQSVYGHTKYEGERLVASYCEKFFIVRTAWLYGKGKNFVRTMIRLMDEGKVIRVVDDQRGNPTSALELARAIVKIMETDAYGIYHGVCSGDCSWFEFAKEIFNQIGSETEVFPITTMEYPTPAKRPEYSNLSNEKLKHLGIYMKHWKDALKEYTSNEKNLRF